jgi:endonuclease YncB( thermonuclease family)
MAKRFCLSFFTFFVISILATIASAQRSFAGEVTGVLDGRTVTLAISSGRINVQLQYIEVPNTGQQMSNTVIDHLRSLVIGKTVYYRPRNILKDRTIGQLTLGGVDISQQMLRDGAAWHIPSEMSGQELGEFKLYASMEASAKSENLGIWSISGLKPAWEFRADKREIERREEKTSFVSNSGPLPAATTTSKTAVNSNPSFGNVGALINRYDPESRTGFLSTAFMPIQVAKDVDSVEQIAVDVTYYYKESDRKLRNGSFVVTVAFLSRNTQFLTNNELTVWDNGKITVIGKPKRQVSNRSDGVYETLIYGVSRNILERAAGNEAVYIKVGKHVIHFTGGRYLLYNLLQVTQ